MQSKWRIKVRKAKLSNVVRANKVVAVKRMRIAKAKVKKKSRK